MIIFVKLTETQIMGADVGPFMVFSNVDNFVISYGINIPKQSLIDGVSITVPDSTASVKIVSNGHCTNEIVVFISGTVPLTSTTTSTSTSSTSTTTLRPGQSTTSTTSTTIRPASTTTTTTKQPRSTTTTSTSTTTTAGPSLPLTTTSTSSTSTSTTSTSTSTTSSSTTSTSTSSTTTTTLREIEVRITTGPPYCAGGQVITVYPYGADTSGCDCLLCAGDTLYLNPSHTVPILTVYSTLYNYVYQTGQGGDPPCDAVWYLTNTSQVFTTTGLGCP